MLAAIATFVNANPSMPALLLLIQALDTAQQTVDAHGRGFAAARDLKADALISGLESERAVVQALVDANPEQAQALAELAGMSIANVSTHAKPVLALKVSEQSGTIEVAANLTLLKKGRGKAKKTTVNYRCTPDGGKTYMTQSIPLASTTFTGLTPMTTAGVQVSIIDADGTTEWSQ